MKRFVPVLLLAGLFLTCVTSGSAQVVSNDDNISSGINAIYAQPKVLPAKAMMGMWNTATALPAPKKYHTVASADGMMYIFAGVTTGNSYDAKSYKYDPGTNQWTAIKDFPVAKFINGQAQTINGKIYITAGLENVGTGWKALTVCYEYDPATNNYTLKAAMPQPQGYAVSGVLNNKMYVIAGLGVKSTDSLNVVQVYDPATNTWSEDTPFPRCLSRLSAATVGNAIICAGGFTANYSFRYSANVYRGEIVDGMLKWTRVKDYPIGPTIYMTGAGLGDYAYFFAGWPSIDNNAPATQRSFRYHVANDEWETLEYKPTGVNILSQGAVINNFIYAAGGENASNIAVDVNEYLNTEASPGPAATLSPTSIDKWVKQGTKPQVVITMKNIGTEELTWSATTTASWMTFVRRSGLCGVMGGTDKLTINLDGTTLPLGESKGSITIVTNDPGKSTIHVDVTVHVSDGEIDADPIVLMEEGTGTWCGYCPYGADSVKAVINRNPGRVVAIAYHNGDVMETPFTAIWGDQIGLTGYPQASINRYKFDGEAAIATNRNKWASYAEYLLANNRSPVSIRVASSFYNPANKEITMDVEVTFHQSLTREVRLSIAQNQNKLSWIQTFYPASGGSTKLNPYEHNHVLKQLVPDEWGVMINSPGAPVQANSKVTKTFTFTSLDSTRETSELIIFAHYCDGHQYGDILQAHEIEVASIATDVSSVADPSSFELLQNYPNPFNPTTTIAYNVASRSAVSIVVYDMFGKEITTLVNDVKDAGLYNATFDASQLPSGSYMFTMKAGGFTQSRIMTLVK